MTGRRPGERTARSRTNAAPTKTFALALGGGGARGLAHIAILEALDELGVKPVALAGSSIGAAIAAAYAAGMSGRAIRRHVIDLMHDRGEVFRRLAAARVGGLADLLPGRFGNPMLLDAEQFCALFLPERVPDAFDKLTMPLHITATDFYARAEVPFSAGLLRPAIAASLAIPGLLRPVEIEGRVLVDGAAVNPLPFEMLRATADVVVAIDTSIGPMAPRGIPDPWDALFSTIQLMGQTILAEKLKQSTPDIVIRPAVGTFRLLDFLQASAILRTAEPAKLDLKRRLMAALAE